MWLCGGQYHRVASMTSRCAFDDHTCRWKMNVRRRSQNKHDAMGLPACVSLGSHSQRLWLIYLAGAKTLRCACRAILCITSAWLDAGVRTMLRSTPEPLINVRGTLACTWWGTGFGNTCKFVSGKVCNVDVLPPRLLSQPWRQPDVQIG
jgi:LSD1 subclass zinc finger protein